MLAEIELPRALRRTEPRLVAEVPGLLARLGLHEIDATVRATAAAYDEPDLRSPDAIHVATAEVALGDRLTAFVTYDRRLRTAAAARSLPRAAPGTTDRS